MHFALLILCLSTIIMPVSAQTKGKRYEYTINLNKVTNDRIQVTLKPPVIKEKTITFYMPKIVPGTYSIADYGRYVQDFTVTDKKGKTLPVERVSTNEWKISNADQATTISYWIDDTLDTPVEGPDIFSPAGTNIEAGKNFIINTSGFFGYLEGEKKIPFRVNIVRSKDFYGTTGLIPTPPKPDKKLNVEGHHPDASEAVDVFTTSDYDELVDSPLMYAKPDTAIIRVANAEVLIGSYSPNQKITAKQIAGSIREILQAQAQFLGGKLPVTKYAFIFYFTNDFPHGAGALEHSYSSMYYLPDATIEQMDQQLKDIAAHEFFHIVTPLTIHSTEIGDFNFNNPAMSRHLWMYEGVTEYFASSVQVKYGLISHDEFLEVMQDKMVTADQYNDTLPFTDLSSYTLDKYHDQYNNVYQKGALIGMCLDIKLRKLSSGKYGLRDLMLQLSEKFGKDKPFKDEELFGIITSMTYPEIGAFLQRYVAGPTQLPLEEVLNDVGVDYLEEDTYEDYSLGISNANIGVTTIDNKQRLQIVSIENQNAMGKAIGLKEGDVIMGMNGQRLPDLGPDLGAFIQQQVQSLPTSKTLSYTVLRKDESGTQTEITLSAPVMKVSITRRHQLQFSEEATPQQLATRNAWLNKP